MRKTLTVAMLALMSSSMSYAQNFSGDPGIVAAAERARVRSAVFWTGREIPPWPTPCPIEWVDKKAESYTKFMFRNGGAADFLMRVSGPRDKVLSDELPHEVDHAVRATLVGKEIPRWLDEGAAALFQSEESRRLMRDTLVYGDLQSSVWDMMTLTEYPRDTDRLTAFYFGSASVVEWMVEQRGASDVLKAMKAGLDSDRDWLLMVGHPKHELRQHYQDWFVAKYANETLAVSETPRVDVLISGDFECPACDSFLAHAKGNRTKREYDYVVNRVSYQDCVARGLTVPQFSVNGEVLTDPIENWSQLDAWCEKKLGLDRPVEIAQETPLENQPLAMGWPSNPQQYRRQSQPPQQPVQQPPQQPVQQPPQQSVPPPPGLTVSNEAVDILAKVLDPSPKTKDPDPAVDWEGMVVVVAASDKVPSVAKVVEGPGKRMLQRFTQGKAILKVISQRTNPEQFDDYEATLGLDIDTLHVSVLLPKAELSAPVDFIVGQIEIKLNAAVENFAGEKLKDIPVEPILERLDEGKFAAIWDVSFLADEARNKEGEPGGTLWMLLGAIGTLLGTKLAGGTQSRLFGWAMRKVHSKAIPEEVVKKPVTRKRGAR